MTDIAGALLGLCLVVDILIIGYHIGCYAENKRAQKHFNELHRMIRELMQDGKNVGKRGGNCSTADEP